MRARSDLSRAVKHTYGGSGDHQGKFHDSKGLPADCPSFSGLAVSDRELAGDQLPSYLQSLAH